MAITRFLVASFVVAAPAANAQTPAGAPSSVVCGIDTLATGETLGSLYLWIPTAAPGFPRDVAEFREAQLRAVLAKLDSLPVLGRRDRVLPPYRATPPGAPELADAQAIVWFQVRGDGRLAGMHLERPSGWNAVDLGIQRAVLRADSSRTLRPLPRSRANEPIDLWFAVGLGRLEGAINLPLGQVRMRGPLASRVWPRVLSVGHRARFPAVAVRAGVGDSLVMEFVVDTAGLAVPETIAPVRASFRDFVEEAARSIRSARFAPGRIGSCPVPMRTRMAMNFFFIGPQ